MNGRADKRASGRGYLVPCWTLSVGCSLFVLFAQSSVLGPQSCFGDDATLQAPKTEKEIPLEPSAPPREDSLDHLKRLWPKIDFSGESPKKEEKPEAEPRVETESPFRKVIFQLQDYNWEQKVNLHIGRFTILGYRDANSHDKMLFRFLTPEEHAEKRVMNSKASLLYTPKKKP